MRAGTWAREIALRTGQRMPARLAAALGPESRGARILRPLVSPLLPAGKRLVRIRSGPARGLAIVIEPRREKAYWSGGYEAHVQRALVDVLRPGACFWDVGAHAGFFTLLAARLVGPTGRLVAVEPMATNRERLRRTLAANGIPNATVLGCAVAGRSGTGLLHAHGSTAMWSLAGGEADGQEVEIRRLDELDPGHPPDVVKLDLEGVELEALEGASAFLLEHRPHLLVEFTTLDMVAAARAALPGYEARQLRGGHWLLSPAAA